MAVKQNNTDGNGSPSSGTGTAASSSSSSATGTSKKNMIPNGGPSNGPSSCNGSSSNSSTNSSSSAASKKEKKSCELANILHLIELVGQKQRNGEFCTVAEIAQIYKQIIFVLAKVSFPRQPIDLKRFKEDIIKVGEFFAKVNEEHQAKIYLYYLQIVCQLITDDEAPSCAIAVIFQLFSDEMVFKAVHSLLSNSNHVQDKTIKKTVKLLCEWLRICNFCQNLNLWILAILNGLREQQKFELIDDIAIEIIEPLFNSLMVPVLRPKVAPIVFHILSSIKHTPEVFHKIISRVPKILNCLKQQSVSRDDYPDDTQKFIQNLVDLTTALMANFQGYDQLYKPMEDALAEFSPSYDYHSILNFRGDDNHFTSDSKYMISTNARVGLVNLGNTCYMNSVLQALAMTKEFSREILLSSSKSPLLVKTQQLIALMMHSLRSELTPSRVLHASRPPSFSPGFQQDSSEFLGYLLETLHEQEIAFKQKSKITIPTQTAHMNDGETSGLNVDNCAGGVDNSMDYDDAEDEATGITNSHSDSNTIPSNQSPRTTSITPTTVSPHANDRAICSTQPDLATGVAVAEQPMTTIEKTFMGKLATTYKCLTCGWQSRNIDSFRDLQLSFPEVKNDCASNYSVQDLIDYYCSPEKLYGDNQYFCEKCKKLSDAERFINVISAPKNLVLTLKHFKYDQKYHMRAKLMHKVFHDENVSVKVCSADSLAEISSVHYDLYAGVVHSGVSMDSGHYYTYAADETNKWYKFDDSIVTSCKMAELHNLTPPNTPYILFYQMGARSSETQSPAQLDTINGANNKIKVEVPALPAVEELSPELRDYIHRDNCLFNEEIKSRKIKLAAAQSAALKSKANHRGGGPPNDDGDEQPPPTSGCGGNVMNFNFNRFVY